MRQGRKRISAISLPQVHDRRAEGLPDEGFAVDEVEDAFSSRDEEKNPSLIFQAGTRSDGSQAPAGKEWFFTGQPKATVIRRTRSDILGHFLATNVVTRTQFNAGRMWQDLYERTMIGAIGAVDTSKEPVDGGKWPELITDGQIRAMKKLRSAAIALGRIKAGYVELVLGHGVMPSESGLKAFCQCLDVLAREFGQETKEEVRRMKPRKAVKKMLKKSAKALEAFILLDRSSSMTDKWSEALPSIDAYVLGFEGLKPETFVSLALFDYSDGKVQFDVVRDRVSAEDWRSQAPITQKPRGSTPLLDAIGRLVALAEKTEPDKAVIVILTDGQENCSQLLSRIDAKAVLDRCRAKGWQVIFLGAAFDSFGDATSLGNAAGQTIAVSSGSFRESMSRLSGSSQSYGATGQSINFSMGDRAAANEASLTNRKAS